MKENSRWHEVTGIRRDELKKAEDETLRRYGDILACRRPEITNHRIADRKQRAAQFLPFAALVGYDDEIESEGRCTEARIELNEEQKAAVNAVLVRVQKTIFNEPEVRMTFFEADPEKSGGVFRRIIARIRKIDALNQEILLSEGKRIRFEDLLEIELAEDHPE
ncbi:MAG: hypothetical protein IKD66_00855 [Solobacterium sp.]|nr:hypothetical protein [Solobacterium sp.]